MKKTPERELRLRIKECDTERLYGPLPGAIAYLRELQAQYGDKQNLTLQEHWSGYETMEMCFSYYEEETDEEMASRLEHERLERARAAKARREAEERKAKMAELNRLKRELGVK